MRPHRNCIHESLILMWLAWLTPLATGAQTVEVVHAFSSPPKGPRAGLIEGADGALYGTSIYGGNGLGTVYRITTNGQLSVFHAFGGSESQPTAPLVRVGTDLYGTTTMHTTSFGTGAHGSVFRLRQDGQLEILHEFTIPSDGQGPYDGLTLGSDGFLYGTTQSGGLRGRGTIFRMDLAGAFTKLYDFGSQAGDGQSPKGGLTEGEPGVFYGVTQSGGSANLGTLFKFTSAGEEVLRSFSNTPGDGRYPTGRPYRDAQGNLWGTTGTGGSFNCGTVFRRDALTSSVAVVHSFGCDASGAYPFSGLLPGPNGRLWGTTAGGYSTGATVFSIGVDSLPAHRVEHVFTGQQVYASGQLLLASDGALYGTTEGPGWGSVYRICEGVFETVRSFELAERGWWTQSLAVGEDGTLYGTTQFGGDRGLGTAFQIDPDGTYQTLHAFEDGDGQGRAPGQTRITWSTADRTLYGIRSAGGAGGGGTLFSLTPSGVRTDLFAFDNGVYHMNGRTPVAAPIEAADGRLYGTTAYGGGAGWGTVYSVRDDGSDFRTLALLNPSTGTEPLGRLVEASDGLLYGTTPYNGGSSPEVGSLFRIGKVGGPSFRKVHDFSSNSLGGSSPASGMTEVTSGRLYGVAGGGLSGKGVLFELAKTGDSYSYSVVHHFAGGTGDGARPNGELVAGSDGFHYGVTTAGGAADRGTVYRLKVGGADYSIVHSFTGADGWSPAALAAAPDGNLYGISYVGGAGGGGVVFRVRLTPICDAGGPYTVDEGGSVTLAATCNRTATYEWDLDEDGELDDAVGENVTFPPAGSSPDGLDEVTVRVRATDEGNLSAEATSTVTVRNVAPTVNVGTDVTLIAGEPLVRAGAFTDPGPDTWTATVDYGDGFGPRTLALSGMGFTLTHVYPMARASYAVAVRVADDDGGVGTDSLQVAVITAEDSIQGLIDDVRELINRGSLNPGQGNSLIAKLEAALKQLGRGQRGTAINQLQAFVNEVIAYIQSGKLTPAEGQPLIDIANRAIAVLSA